MFNHYCVLFNFKFVFYSASPKNKSKELKAKYKKNLSSTDYFVKMEEVKLKKVLFPKEIFVKQTNRTTDLR